MIVVRAIADTKDELDRFIEHNKPYILKIRKLYHGESGKYKQYFDVKMAAQNSKKA